MAVGELLAELVAIPSVSGNEKWLAERLAALLLDGGASVAQDGRNVCARRGDGGPTLLLNSHIDTVPPVDGWTTYPWNPRIEGDRLVGLGANDAKASVAAMLEAFLTAPAAAARARFSSARRATRRPVARDSRSSRRSSPSTRPSSGSRTTSASRSRRRAS